MRGSPTVIDLSNDQPVLATDAVPPRSRAVAVRRWALVACPVLAGLFAVLGAYADPGAGVSPDEP